MTKLTFCRKDRRYWKDQVEELEPLINIFILTDDNANADRKAEIQRNSRVLNLLREALGQTRKVERYHSDRHYKPKIFQADS